MKTKVICPGCNQFISVTQDEETKQQVTECGGEDEGICNTYIELQDGVVRNPKLLRQIDFAHEQAVKDAAPRADISYIDYIKYIKFVFSEELERMSEFLYGVEKEYDQSEDKYYVKHIRGECPPDFEDVKIALFSRDVKKDLELIKSDKDEEKEQLWLELRDILLEA